MTGLPTLTFSVNLTELYCLHWIPKLRINLIESKVTICGNGSAQTAPAAQVLFHFICIRKKKLLRNCAIINFVLWPGYEREWVGVVLALHEKLNKGSCFLLFINGHTPNCTRIQFS